MGSPMCRTRLSIILMPLQPCHLIPLLSLNTNIRNNSRSSSIHHHNLHPLPHNHTSKCNKRINNIYMSKHGNRKRLNLASSLHLSRNHVHHLNPNHKISDPPNKLALHNRNIYRPSQGVFSLQSTKAGRYWLSTSLALQTLSR